MNGKTPHYDTMTHSVIVMEIFLFLVIYNVELAIDMKELKFVKYSL